MEQESLARLSALAHPARMGLYRLLMRRYPDELPAGEIARVQGLKASTASVYLSALTEVGLLRQRRAGTSLLYRAHIPAVQAMMDYLFNDCCRGRPELCPPAPALSQPKDAAMPTRKFNVLFICSGNSARSIFAEALMRRIAGDRFEVFSAGTKPYSEINPIVLEMLADKGHDISRLRAKNVAEFQAADAAPMDFVFTVCDLAANELCPPWPGQPLSAHWGMPDPVKATGTAAERKLAFQRAYAGLKHRIEAFAALPVGSLDRISLQAAMDEIGAGETAPLPG